MNCPVFEEIKERHEELLQNLVCEYHDEKPIDLAEVRDFISLILDNSRRIVNIEDRRECRKMLRIWASYFTRFEDESLDIHFDRPDRLPAVISTRNDMNAVFV